ncbi:MerR family transcriptional regulator [Streptomyces sp. NPDC001508]|uniref:DNA polymerase III subunit beta family protein n=1 Tax=Streptomyces sp. NPDC001508 TaxID=3154656 RepID=UPI00332BA94A
MPNSELMPIGVFARRSGLTPSALRFYADSGLLPPAEVDPVSGYRYYSADQVVRATQLRQLRGIAMPLAAVEVVLSAEPHEAARMIDEHVATVLGDAAAVQRKAALIKSSLTDLPSLPIAALKGPVLADAIEQVLTATARDPGMPVLGGLRVEASGEAVTLTATDRYRLSTRTLVPAEAATTTWAATVNGDELRAAAGEIRRSALVRVEATPHGIWLRTANREGSGHSTPPLSTSTRPMNMPRTFPRTLTVPLCVPPSSRWPKPSLTGTPPSETGNDTPGCEAAPSGRQRLFSEGQ